MLKVGLTGSIAVGKSHVAAIFSELGCHVLDADVTAREVVEVGSEGLKKIAETFGKEVLKVDGTLDRNKLGAIVFEDEEKRKLLNSILHPIIITKYDEQMRIWESKDPNSIGIVDAALMIESGSYKRFDKLIVVHCQTDVQLSRLMNRNNLTKEEALRRISSQMPQEEKKSYADFLIDTSGSFEETRKQVEDIYERLKAIKK
jgi:dephospho-CoA kinase